MRTSSIGLFFVVSVTLLIAVPPSEARADAELPIGAKSWQILPKQSGPVNYYSVVQDSDRSFVHGRYAPPWKTAVVGYKLAEEDQRRIKKIRWDWRALILPNGGDECASGREDSAAVVYLIWKRGLRYYTIKYVWSAVGQKGRICDHKRNPFLAQDTVIVQSGGPLGTWRSVDIDLAAAFRRHFEHNDSKAEVPDFIGLGLMTDGDQTNSESAADYGNFVLSR